MNERLVKVQRALEDYEHPLLDFGAQPDGRGIEVTISLKHPVDGIDSYTFTVHPREIDHPQFRWEFQQQLYNCLHDFLIEMFTRNPQRKNY